MKILLIRHGDPDFEIDGLTEKGKREVALLTKRLLNAGIDKIYCSPRGRARLTAAPIAEALGMEVEIVDLMREFNWARMRLPYLEGTAIAWEVLPEYINNEPDAYEPRTWSKMPCIEESDIYEGYRAVCNEFDSIIARHGYERDGYNYRAVRPNHDTIAIFCHGGIIGMLLSHLMNCSPYSTWQHTCALASSVTTICTEERREGAVLMRIIGFSDISHLYAGGEEPSFSARFCECFDDATPHG